MIIATANPIIYSELPEINPSTNEEQINNNDFEDILLIASNVFNMLGSGFIENIYHKAMLIDLSKIEKYDIIGLRTGFSNNLCCQRKVDQV